ncbi:hypothetical protein Bca52824_080659 [Brassica carinata]|uniref:Uncharacterized protein n=1 Tax=Brassica carinata TaxID=52824 RepID=A0A8X7PH76_BRACI|nr:hypothetical protein Bca52824_080659 [Brassica carinata]
MAISRILLSDLKAGRCSNNVEMRLLRSWEARNVKKGGELMWIDLLFVDEKYIRVHHEAMPRLRKPTSSLYRGHRTILPMQQNRKRPLPPRASGKRFVRRRDLSLRSSFVVQRKYRGRHKQTPQPWERYRINMQRVMPPESCHRNDMDNRCEQCYHYKQIIRGIEVEQKRSELTLS